MIRIKSSLATVLSELLEFDGGTGFFEFFLGFFGVRFGSGFLESSRCAFNELLGVGKTESFDSSTNRLNDSDLIFTKGGKNDVKFVFFFSGVFATSCGTCSSNCCRSCGANAPFIFESLNKVCDFENGQTAQLFYDFISISHFILWVSSS